MDLTSKAAQALARRSSRRQFFKFLAAGSLGTGLFLTGTDVSIGAITGCVGCGGGPLQPLRLTGADLRGGRFLVQDLPAGRRLPRRLQHRRRVVLLPDHGACRLPDSLLRVQLPGRLREPVLSLLHAAQHPVHSTAALGRPALRLPAVGGADS